jgi:hypothetical protein
MQVEVLPKKNGPISLLSNESSGAYLTGVIYWDQTRYASGSIESLGLDIVIASN